MTALNNVVLIGCFLPTFLFAAPKNIILMIIDGAGFNHVDAVSLYQSGETGGQVYEQFPVKLAMSAFSAGGGYDGNQAIASFNYVLKKPTDSAAAATAMATGVKVRNGVISVDHKGKPLKTIRERAEEMGKSTGVVSSVQFSNATTACTAAHQKKRNNFLEIASEMILESGLDLIMGCGHPEFDDNGKILSLEDADSARTEYVGGKGIWEALIAGTVASNADADTLPEFWSLVQTRDQFRSLMIGHTPERVIGIPQVSRTLQNKRTDMRGKNRYQADLPWQVPFSETVPTLAEMTSGALNVLDANLKGFFIMIEGGAVDWAAHNHESGRMIEEMSDFNSSVEAAIDWIYSWSDWDETLLIVTSDHETGYLTGEGSNPEMQPLVNYGKGKMPGMEWHTGGHTNLLVPFYARGDGSEEFVSRAVNYDPMYGNYIDNSDIAKVLFKLWRE